MDRLPQKFLVVVLVLLGLFVLAALGKATPEVCTAAVTIASAFCAANVYLTKSMSSTGTTTGE